MKYLQISELISRLEQFKDAGEVRVKFIEKNTEHTIDIYAVEAGDGGCVIHGHATMSMWMSVEEWKANRIYDLKAIIDQLSDQLPEIAMGEAASKVNEAILKLIELERYLIDPNADDSDGQEDREQ